ncbi:hypothetical protein NE237_013278 [Protea cynaroides]|uniref:Uncharacterized protein n=1 Tax=Protea cynaroides TaxID=273540 RepID=A0A9Q0JZN1_9MAGN|nr:hypothetical protein NE237_013278 [Protea cynaroides]
MNKKLFRIFEIPTQSILSKILSWRNDPFTPFSRIESLCPIDFEFVLAIVAMVVTTIVEAKRRVAVEHNVMLSGLWFGFQFFLLSISDFVTLSGMFEFFYSQAPTSMRSTCTALTWHSISIDYFLSSALVLLTKSRTKSSALVLLTNLVTKLFNKEWLGGIILNNNRLDLLYTLVCVLNLLNFLNYLYWAECF